MGCAKQGYPPGGSLDKMGPRILRTHPDGEAFGVPTDIRPWVLLNEYPALSSIEGSIFISPEPEGGYRAKTKGKRIEVRFERPLPADRTVVITFGSGISDIHGNQMEASFNLAFSTGETIDRAAIVGKLEWITNPAATWIWAYPLDSFSEPDPRRDKAPFATQPHIEGEYELRYLPEGFYRVFAVADARRNRFWDSEQEAIAFPPGDVAAVQEDPPVVNLRMALCDMKPPSLRGVQALHRQALRISFDEPVDISELRFAAETQKGITLPIIDAYLNPSDSTALLLTTAPQREGDEYTLHLNGIADGAGNRVDSLIATVQATVVTDTSGPHLSWSYPAEGEIEVDTETDVRVGFSEAVVLTDLPRAVHLLDSTGEQVSGQWSFPTSGLGIFKPSEPLPSGARYTVNVVGDSLRDIFANFSRDSLVSFNFTTMDFEWLGAITGVIRSAEENLRVVADRLGGTGGSWEAAATETGQYEIGKLPAARYRLWLYQDRDGNGRFSPGRMDPFTFAEPFTASRDTVRVRPRWETEGVELFWGQESEIQSPNSE